MTNILHATCMKVKRTAWTNSAVYVSPLFSEETPHCNYWSCSYDFSLEKLHRLRT